MLNLIFLLGQPFVFYNENCFSDIHKITLTHVKYVKAPNGS